MIILNLTIILAMAWVFALAYYIRTLMTATPEVKR